MREVIQHEPGTFCWPELATTDAESAKALYGGLFGWTFDDQIAGRPAPRTRPRGSPGRDVAALYVLQRSQRQLGVAAHWNAYAAVEERRRGARSA